jgi:hypothetical protein
MPKPIDWQIVRQADIWLDDAVSADYQNQPLAQDWARVAKMSEEIGEAIAELISMTGQNPRKPRDSQAYVKFLKEMGDAVITGILGIQHFTKDTELTQEVINGAIAKLAGRIPERYWEG